MRPRFVSWRGLAGYAMTDLRKAAYEYLAVRRRLGFALVDAGRLLPDFVAFLEQRGVEHISTEWALQWAVRADAQPAWQHLRLGVVRGFAEYVRHTDPATQVPPRNLLPGNYRAAVELADRDHRHVEFHRQQLEAAGELRHLRLARFDSLTRRHQLQVVDHDQPQIGFLFEPAVLGADLHHRQVRRVVDVQRGLADLRHPPPSASDPRRSSDRSACRPA